MDGNSKHCVHYPPGLKYLKMENYRAFSAEEYAKLPNTLKRIDLSNVPLTDPSVLPQWVEYLHLRNTAITEFPVGLFPNLLQLEIHNDECIQVLNVPEKVVILDLRSLNSLRKINGFPPKLDQIDFRSLDSLTEIPAFPFRLKSLNIDNVPITRLPQFPHSKAVISISGTKLPPELLYTPEEDTGYEPFGITITHKRRPEWIARVNPLLEDMDEKNRIQRRCRLLQGELRETVFSPERVAKWLGEGEGNWDLVDAMMGIA